MPRHGPIRSVRLDEMAPRLLVAVTVAVAVAVAVDGGSEDQLQMLAFALEVAEGEDPHGKLEDVQFDDAGAGVAEGGGRGGVHRQGGHFRDGVPAGGTDSCVWENGFSRLARRGT